jgi:hypothetical protein
VIDSSTASSPIAGRLVATGCMTNGLFARAFAVFNVHQVNGYVSAASDTPVLPDSVEIVGRPPMVLACASRVHSRPCPSGKAAGFHSKQSRGDTRQTPSTAPPTPLSVLFAGGKR